VLCYATCARAADTASSPRTDRRLETKPREAGAHASTRFVPGDDGTLAPVPEQDHRDRSLARLSGGKGRMGSLIFGDGAAD
jgi:hypothetical protein